MKGSMKTDYGQISHVLQCHSCAGSLELGSSRLRCRDCGAVYPISRGIPVLATRDDYYFEDIPKDQMETLIRETQEHGWDEAFSRVLSTMPPQFADDLRQYVTDEGRVNVQFLLSLPQNGTALDFGSGWGNLTLGLSEFCGTVVSADLTLQRIQIAQARAQQEGRSNVFAVCGTDTERLPFATSSFDVVFLSGILEWVASGMEGHPGKLQSGFLNEIRRILKPNGQLYLAIENRFCVRFILGSLDPHSRRRFTSLMPHALARVYTRLRFGVDYRTPIYSYHGYSRLLRRSGFRSTRFYLPLPRYSCVEQIISAKMNRLAMKTMTGWTWRGRLFWGLMRKTGLYPWLTHSYAIIAQPSEPAEPSFLEQMLLSAAVSCGQSEDEYTFTHLVVARDHKLVVFTHMARLKSPGPVFLLALNSFEAEWLTQTAEMLDAIHARRTLPEDLKLRIPRTIFSGEIRKNTFIAQTRIPGVRADLIRPNLRSKAIRHGVGFISDLHKATAVACADPKKVFNLLRAPLDVIEHHRPGVLADDLLERCTACWHAVAEGGMPLVLQHGDYGLYNIFVSHNGEQLEGVIDWDSASFDGLPLLDLTILLLMAPGHAERSLADSYPRLLASLVADADNRLHLQTYCSLVGLNRDQVGALLLSTYFRCLSPMRVLEDVYLGRPSTRKEVELDRMPATVRGILDFIEHLPGIR